MIEEPQKLQSVLPGTNGKKITADVTFIHNQRPKAAVIFAHGFKGFKDWGHFNEMASIFAKHDIFFVKFNFSHNGTLPENQCEFADLEAFGNNNYMIELNDLTMVINWVLTHEAFEKEIDHAKVNLLGHSRGGGISILKASEDRRINKVVTWAAVSDFVNRNKKKTIQTWERDGVVYTENRRTKQMMPLYIQFYESLIENKDKLNILRAASHLKIPFLIVHGTEDEAVDTNDARQLHKACAHSELYLLEGAGHTFGVRHPYNGTLPPHANAVINRTITFFKGQR
jgi:uncharacterized protein